MNRIAYFDFLRGLAIIMVCGIHTWHITDFDSLQGIMSILLRQILNCAVPLFFSNIFCSKKYLKKKLMYFLFGNLKFLKYIFQL